MRWFDNFDVHGLGRNCNVQTLFMRVVPRQFFQAVLLTQSFFLLLGFAAAREQCSAFTS